jgi:hypothetical protein
VEFLCWIGCHNSRSRIADVAGMERGKTGVNEKCPLSFNYTGVDQKNKAIKKLRVAKT